MHGYFFIWIQYVDFRSFELVVRSKHTSDNTINHTKELLEKAKKSSVVLKKELPGYIANRPKSALVQKAFRNMEEGGLMRAILIKPYPRDVTSVGLLLGQLKQLIAVESILGHM